MPSTKRKSPEDDDEEQQHDDAGADGVDEEGDDQDEEAAAVEAAIGDADMSMDDGGDLHQHDDNTPDHGVVEEAQSQDGTRAAVGGDAQWNATDSSSRPILALSFFNDSMIRSIIIMLIDRKSTRLNSSHVD